jgi:hypothetical protein
MTRYQNHAGFHISNNRLQLVEVNNIDNNFVAENVDEEYFSDFFSFDEKETKLVSILQNAYNEIALRRKLTSSFISFTLPANAFYLFDIPIDEALTKTDLEEHINWELSILAPDCESSSLAVQLIKMNESRLRKSNNLIVLAIKKNILNLLDKFAVRNNIKLRFVDNEHLSANNILLQQNKLDPESVYITLLVKENYFSIVLIENRLPVYFTIRKYKNSIEFAELFKSELKKLSLRIDGDSEINDSYIFGEYSKSLLHNITKVSGLTFQPVNPFIGLKFSNTMTNSDSVILQSAQYTSAAGIAFRLV